LLSSNILSKKPLLFKSFTGLRVQEFDDIYNNEITKKYKKQRASGYHPNGKKVEKERLVQVDISR